MDAPILSLLARSDELMKRSLAVNMNADALSRQLRDVCRRNDRLIDNLHRTFPRAPKTLLFPAAGD